MLKTGSNITISAALLALLAGCGSGTGTDQNPGSTRATKAPTNLAAIDDASISTELLASILLANTGGANRASYYTQYPAHPWTGPVPGGRQQAAPKNGNVLGYQSFFPSVDEFSINSFPGGNQHHTFLEDSRRFTHLRNQYELRIDQKAQIEQTTGGSYVLKPAAHATAGKPILTIDKRMTVMTNTTYMPSFSESDNPQRQEGPEKTVALQSADAYQLKAGERVPFYRSLHRWQDGQGNFSELLLLKGEQARAGHQDVRLCVNTHAPDVKRLHCSIWQVPLGWQSGAPVFPHYEGIYTVDDRSVYPGESGLKYWQTPEDPRKQAPRAGMTGPRPPSTPMGAIASAPITDAGISGDVLATMLTQNTHDLFQQALPWTAPVPWGQQSQQAGQEIHGGQQLWHMTNRVAQNFTYKAWTFTYAHNPNLRYSLASFDIDMSVLTSLPHGQNANEAFRFTGQYAQGTELINLGHNVKLGSPIDPNNQMEMMMHPNGGFSIRKAQFFPFNQGLQRWRSKNGDFIEMLLLRAARPDQARLCFNFHAPKVKRLQCSNWQVPSGWTLGQPLISRGFSVIDDRSTYPGETGLRYWQTEALN
ncbi:MAG: hypothetical protein Q4D91_03770 [Lautropia sp.]|nr:hypothetical protein [Lautropia sp.]